MSHRLRSCRRKSPPLVGRRILPRRSASCLLRKTRRIPARRRQTPCPGGLLPPEEEHLSVPLSQRPPHREPHRETNRLRPPGTEREHLPGARRWRRKDKPAPARASPGRLRQIPAKRAAGRPQGRHSRLPQSLHPENETTSLCRESRREEEAETRQRLRKRSSLPCTHRRASIAFGGR